ncbi:tetratricopeptide repeat protein 7B [Patella vulgata]|uniref:tetratricopeptide repeat protein 7B n=1 Tax=Patella vulgata TaxID=6465 RepID=UPI00217FC89E|nr:tetratricopeptide repeat protein 7B [Patella vulgata]
MASKLKPARLESEIERCRTDSNWKRACELAQQLVQKSPDMVPLVNFILAERELEEFLNEHPPSERTIAKAKNELNVTEQRLYDLTKNKALVKFCFESQLLLAKLQFCKGAYQNSMTTLEKSDFESKSIDRSSNRQLLLLAEAHAIKGMCLEKTALQSTSKFRVTEREQQIIECLEQAGDLALLYLQEREKHQANTGMFVVPAHPTSDSVGLIIEYAIQQTPILHIKNGDIQKGIGRFRELLRAVETRCTQNLRLTLARQLAEVLMRGVCTNTYIPVCVNPLSPSNDKKPHQYVGKDLFVPTDENEETLLLLLIAEAVATREAVLDRTQELNETRLHAFQNTTSVYDLLAIALVKRAQFSSLAESFERAMRFSFEEFHIWHQMANSLICAGKYAASLLVLRECWRLQPENAVVCLQAARLCYEYLHQYNEGIEWSKRVCELSDNNPLLARAHIAYGIGKSMAAIETKLQKERQSLNMEALTAFKKAHALDPFDFLALFHMSLQLAIMRHIPEANHYVRTALKYRNDHIHSLHLLTLLLTSQKQYGEALDLIHAALAEYPDNLSLLLTKSKLEEVTSGPEEALNTCKLMMKLWKDIHEIDSDDSSDGKGATMDRNTFDKRSLAQLTINEFSERGSGSIRAESVAASRMERALSEVASSLNSGLQARPGSQQSWMLQAQIWLHLAELYLSQDKTSEAENCVNETSNMFPLSHQVYFMKGRVLEHKQKYLDAKVCFENAVAINPGHTKSLQHLGMVLHHLNENKLAEKALKEAVAVDPMSHQAWFSLGLVLEALGHSETAADCHATGVDLEFSSPIVSFTVIPRLMQ